MGIAWVITLVHLRCFEYSIGASTVSAGAGLLQTEIEQVVIRGF